mgnify:CR=1 FL=1
MYLFHLKEQLTLLIVLVSRQLKVLHFVCVQSKSHYASSIFQRLAVRAGRSGRWHRVLLKWYRLSQGCPVKSGAECGLFYLRVVWAAWFFLPFLFFLLLYNILLTNTSCENAQNKNNFTPYNVWKCTKKVLNCR